MSTIQNMVSVVIPAYNSAEFIDRAIRSAVEQDYEPKEIIVVDDGSTDETPEKVKAWGDKVRYFRQENQGPDPARNLGVEKARGEFIAFLDSDDEYLPGRLSKCVQPMIDDPEVGMVWCLVIQHFPNGQEIIFGHEGHEKYPFKWRIWQSSRQQTSGTTIRRNIYLSVHGFDRPLLAFADHDLFMRVREVSKVKMIDEPLLVYYVRPTSRSRSKDLDKVRECYLGIAHDAVKRRPDLYSDRKNMIIADAHYYVGLRYYADLDHREARKNFMRAFLLYPRPFLLKRILETLLPSRFMHFMRKLKKRA
ncbi:MAG: glycosyltransferase family A protein [Candidatus Sumerlaeia bacterium]